MGFQHDGISHGGTGALPGEVNGKRLITALVITCSVRCYLNLPTPSQFRNSQFEVEAHKNLLTSSHLTSLMQ